MPLPDSQFGGMRVLRLINPLLQLSLPGWFGHWVCCYYLGHWGFLSEGLWVSCTVPYHHNCLFTPLPECCVHVLYSEALWKRAIFSPQGLYHDVNVLSSIGLPAFTSTTWEQKASIVSTSWVNITWS